MYAKHGSMKEADMSDHWMRLHLVMYATGLEDHGER